MAGQQNSKKKLLYIKDILEKYSDEKHVMNSADILSKLEFQYGIQCERKSLYSDIDVLESYGVDIVRTRTPRNGFLSEHVSLNLPKYACCAMPFRQPIL